MTIDLHQHVDLCRSGDCPRKLTDLPFSSPQRLRCTLASRPQKRSVSTCSQHCLPAPIEIDLCQGTYPAFCFALDGRHKVRGEKVHEGSEFGSELPARRPQ